MLVSIKPLHCTEESHKKLQNCIVKDVTGHCEVRVVVDKCGNYRELYQARCFNDLLSKNQLAFRNYTAR